MFCPILVQELVKVSNALKSTEARVEELIKEEENKGMNFRMCLIILCILF